MDGHHLAISDPNKTQYPVIYRQSYTFLTMPTELSPMNIETIVKQAMQEGCITPLMESEVGRLCEQGPELTNHEYTALKHLMQALKSGEVVLLPRKQFMNVMEGLVMTEAIAQVADIEASTGKTLDLGDIAAYALNHLSPLYATTEEGAEFQRDHAHTEIATLITQHVREAILHTICRPKFHPERQALDKSTTASVLSQIDNLLKDLADEEA